VVTERVGAAEVVEASGGGVVAGSGPHDLAAALASLLASNNKLATMGVAGARYAREQLTWRAIALRFAEMYGEMAEQGPRHIGDGHVAAA